MWDDNIRNVLGAGNYIKKVAGCKLVGEVVVCHQLTEEVWLQYDAEDVKTMQSLGTKQPWVSKL
eukprot:SAG31_NODE_9076_length_1339_cov_1.739516_1_plen_63_part_10